MSFRKRGEILGAPAVPGRVPAVPRPLGNLPNRGGVGAPNPLVAQNRVPGSRGPLQPTKTEEAVTKNPGVRPSLITSQPTVSTGCADLDKILQHQGLPVGQSLLVEESGTTDFASVILRSFTSQGVIHNRINKGEFNCHSIIVGLTPDWAKELPGLYKGSSKDQKKAKIIENESKVSVSNLANDDMKIAWRYGLNKKADSGDSGVVAYEGYCNQFDITQKLIPGPSPQDMSFIPLNENYLVLVNHIKKTIDHHIKSNGGKIIRLVIPNLLNPSLYNFNYSSPTFIFPFAHSLRSLLRTYSKNVVLISSLPLDLYPRESNLTNVLETLYDSVIHLQPFNQEMSQFIEKAYKNEPSKVQHGLVNIIRLPILSEKGLMMIHNGEYAFKNGRKKFEIEEWGIPVDEEAKDESKPESEGPQTTKNVDF